MSEQNQANQTSLEGPVAQGIFLEDKGKESLLVADFEQSGKIRSETRQLLQKYLLGLLGYIGSFIYYSTRGGLSQTECLGAVVMSFVVFVILLKCVNLYTEQIQIATHHIRNQASHRRRFGEHLVGLQDVKLFSRQRSISRVASFFVPHWTTRTEFSMVYAMIGAAFLPILQSWFFWEKIPGITNPEIYYILEVAIALMLLSKSLLDIFSYLVASRVTTPDNPVPTMKKTHLVEMPMKQNVEDSFVRNKKLLAATLFVFSLLCIIFFSRWDAAGADGKGLFLKLFTNLAPYVTIIWYVRVVNQHLFDDHIYRKSGIGLHAISLLMMSFVGICFFLIWAPVFDKLPPISQQAFSLWSFCAILLGGVMIIECYFGDKAWNAEMPWMMFKRKATLYSVLFIFLSTALYVVLYTAQLTENFDKVYGSLISYWKSTVTSIVEEKKFVVWSIVWVPVIFLALAISFWIHRQNKRLDERDIFHNRSWKVIVRSVFGTVTLLTFLARLNRIHIVNLFLSDADAGQTLLYLLFLVPSVVVGWLVWRVISSYIAGIPKKPQVSSVSKGVLGSMVGLCVGIIIYNYSTELFLMLNCLLILSILFLAGRRDGIPKKTLSVYSFMAVVLLCFMFTSGLNRLQFGLGNDAGASFVQFFNQYGVVNRYLLSPPSGRPMAWPAVFLAINIFVFGIALLCVFFKFLVSAARLYEYKSLEDVVSKSYRPEQIWSGAEWRVERPKKNVFLYLQSLLVLLLAALVINPFWVTDRYVLIALSCLLLYLTISDLFFEAELLFCGQWVTEFSGMHLLADDFVRDAGSLEKIIDYLGRHGVSRNDLDAFIKRYGKDKKRTGSDKQVREGRAAIRRLIDGNFYTTLKRRMNAIFLIDHSTSRAPMAKKNREMGRGFKNGLNNDRHILARSLRLLNRSSLLTPVRYVFLKPWSRELISVYDNLGQPYQVWRNRASFLTNTPIHASVVEAQRGRRYRIMLSSVTQAGQRMLAGVAKSIHESVDESEKTISRWKKLLLSDPNRNLRVLKKRIVLLDNKHQLQEAIPPHKVLLACRDLIDNDGDGEQIASVLRAYKEIDVVFMGNCGGRHYDVLGIPYVHNKTKSYGFSDLISLKSHLSFLQTHYHPSTLLRLKPDLVIMCGSSYFNINLAKFCRKINSQIQLIYLSPPHAEVSTHANDTRVDDVVKLSDRVVTSTQRQHAYYKDIIETAQTGIGNGRLSVDCKQFENDIVYYGHPLPKWFYQAIRNETDKTIEKKIQSLSDGFAYDDKDLLTIYAGSDKGNFEKVFRMAMIANEEKKGILNGKKVIFLVPDMDSYKLFREYAQAYIEKYCGIPSSINEPISFKNFDVVVLRKFYNDSMDQVAKIRKATATGEGGALTEDNDGAAFKRALDPFRKSRMFNRVYELDMGVIVTNTSCLIGFSDALMGIISLFVPTISIVCKKKMRYFLDSLTGACVRPLGEIKSPRILPSQSQGGNYEKVLSAEDKLVYAYEKIPTQIISNFMKETFESGWKTNEGEEVSFKHDLSNFRLDCVVHEGVTTGEDTWKELLREACSMVVEKADRKEYYMLSGRVISSQLLAFDEDNSVRSFYGDTARDCLKCLFERVTLHTNQ